MTFSDVMKTRLADGSLRKAHVTVLGALGKSAEAIPFAKIVKASKLNARSVHPSLLFLVSEDLAKEQVSEDAGRTFKITGEGRKALSKAEKAAA